MRAVLLVDEAVIIRRDPHFAQKRDWPKHALAEYSVADAMRTLGHQVAVVPATANVEETLGQILSHKPKFVFNLVEQIDDSRDFDGLYVRILELLRIPYTGASSDVLQLARNKQLSKLVVAQAGVTVPNGVVLDRVEPSKAARLQFPLIVKPLKGDGSEGVASRSLVKNSAALRQTLARLLPQAPLLCEEYIPGREIILTMSGQSTVSVDSICELVFPERAPVKFATALAKFDKRYRERYGIFYRTPTVLEPRIRANVVRAAHAAYRALDINAYGKLEFRIDGDRIVFIEANPNSQMSRFANSTDFRSIGYEAFVGKIIRMALRR